MSMLLQYRDEIDKIDKNIVELFEKRMELSKDVAAYKINTKKPVLDPIREQQKIKTLTGLASSEFNAHGVEELFTQVMAMSRKLQYKLLAENGLVKDLGFKIVDNIDIKDAKVVYQGVPGAYSHAATIKYFGTDENASNVKTFREAMEYLDEGKADYAVLPMENSTAGIVSDVYDLLVEFDNVIVEDFEVEVNHAVLGTMDAELSDIKTVYSHQQALMQSSIYLNGKKWHQIMSENTAVSAKMVAEQNNKCNAAIGSTNAAKVYGLKVLKEHINNTNINTTRFIVVTSKRICKKNADTISLSFEVPHESGCLYNILSNIIYNDLNMTKIESRPIPDKKWEFRFYVNFNGKINDSGVVNALNGILAEAKNVKLLGNY